MEKQLDSRETAMLEVIEEKLDKFCNGFEEIRSSVLRDLNPEWYERIVRRNTVSTLADTFDVETLRDMFLKLHGRNVRQQNINKLARLLKDEYVRKYANNDISVLLSNVSDHKYMHLVTFQKKDVYRELTVYGYYEPNPRMATEPATEIITQRDLEYYPVWFVNPLVLGQNCIDKNAFCLRSFMGLYETAFPMHRYDISSDFYLIEVRVDSSKITEKNSSYLCTCLPDIKMKNVVGIYTFYYNDPDCKLPNTRNEPYIKVVNTFDDSAMCTCDYASALFFKTYTGTEDDFDL